jgi:hypothetical protein
MLLMVQPPILDSKPDKSTARFAGAPRSNQNPRSANESAGSTPDEPIPDIRLIGKQVIASLVGTPDDSYRRFTVEGPRCANTSTLRFLLCRTRARPYGPTEASRPSHHAAAGGSRADNTVAAARQDKPRNTGMLFFAQTGYPVRPAHLGLTPRPARMRSCSLRRKQQRRSESAQIVEKRTLPRVPRQFHERCIPTQRAREMSLISPA